ncbi:MAG TPA: helix-turn-helix domain-containing protein [Alteraurantiacibacter sp.]
MGPYANALGCTQKSLNRATQGLAGLNAKDCSARRIALEAKRLLAHTDRPIYLIAEGLGFDEATNFSKFFRKHAGQSPAEFRTAYRA